MVKYANMTPEQKRDYMRDYRKKKAGESAAKQGKQEPEKVDVGLQTPRSPRKPRVEPGLQGTTPKERKPRNPAVTGHFLLKYIRGQRHYTFSEVNTDGTTHYLGTRGRSQPLMFGNLQIDLDWADHD